MTSITWRVDVSEGFDNNVGVKEGGGGTVEVSVGLLVGVKVAGEVFVAVGGVVSVAVGGVISVTVGVEVLVVVGRAVSVTVGKEVFVVVNVGESGVCVGGRDGVHEEVLVGAGVWVFV